MTWVMLSCCRTRSAMSWHTLLDPPTFSSSKPHESSDSKNTYSIWHNSVSANSDALFDFRSASYLKEERRHRAQECWLGAVHQIAVYDSAPVTKTMCSTFQLGDDCRSSVQPRHGRRGCDIHPHQCDVALPGLSSV